MILYTDATTPFGRKCVIAALEREIPLEERFIKLSEPGDFLEVNPLNQIPALFIKPGKCYFDSDVILDYLDTCLLYTSPSPRDGLLSRMPSSA